MTLKHKFLSGPKHDPLLSSLISLRRPPDLLTQETEKRETHLIVLSPGVRNQIAVSLRSTNIHFHKAMYLEAPS